MVHIGEAHRTNHFGHTMFATPLRGGVEEGVDHLVVVDEVDEAEAEQLLVGALVDHTVDDCGDTTHVLAVAIGHKALTVAKIEGGVDLRREGVDIIADQRRHRVRVVAVKVDAKLCEAAQLAARGGYWANFYTHCSSFIVLSA